MTIRRKPSFADIVDSHFRDLERELEHWREVLVERPSWDLKTSAIEPLRDVRTTPTEVIVTVDLPLTVETSLQVRPLDGNALDISAKMKRKMSFKDLGITHHKGEFRTLHCHSSIPVPVRMDKMTIQFRKGILEIRLPRKRERSSKQTIT